MLEISRRPTDPVRLGRPTSTTLVVANPSSRTVTGLLRDAWQPTAGATANRFPGRRPVTGAPLRTPLQPVRRGGLARARRHRPRSRASRAGLASADDRRAVWSGRCRRSSPASTFRRDWRGCATSTAGRRCGCAVRARSSTPCGSTCRATTSARSTGGRRHATVTWSSAPGSPKRDSWLTARTRSSPSRSPASRPPVTGLRQTTRPARAPAAMSGVRQAQRQPRRVAPLR